MKTQCNQETFLFQTQNRRHLVAHFNGGNITSDAGGLLLQQTERITGIIKRFAACFTDHRDPDLIEHSVEELVAQRIYALALGYEDLNDHDELRNDPLLAVLVGKDDPAGQDRIRSRDKGKALAGKSTLNRLELTPVRANQLRLWFSSVAYTLMLALRRLGLKDTKLAKAQCGTIRVKLLKIGAQIRLTVRKIWVSLSEGYPYQQLFRQVYKNLVRLCPIPLRC
jgi:hypothetical protein